jgi:ABC-2 type transport system permease protein
VSRPSAPAPHAPRAATSAPPPETPDGGGTAWTGTWRLLRLAARQDRIVLTVWLVALLVLLAGSVGAVVGIYATDADLLQYAVVASSNAIARAFDGPMAGASLGAITMTESYGVLALLAGIMSVQTVTRHTRREEETGRAELIGSAVVGRHAPLSAALLLATLANLVLAVGSTAVLVASGLPSTSSVLAGIVIGAAGLTFAGVAAVTAQLAETARGANARATAVIGLAFLLRAVGDAFGTVAESGIEVVSAWPSWLSPIGWGQQARAFGDDRWWVLVLFALAIAGGVLLAFTLTSHRDLGAAMRPMRPGAPRASRWLRSPAGLLLRQQRAMLLGWAVGLTLVALAFGAIAEEAESLLETSDELAEFFAVLGDGALTDLFVAFGVALLAIVVGAAVVQSVLRLRAEEVAGRTEPLLATAVSRPRLLLTNLAIAVLAATAMLLLIGLVGGIAHLATGGPVDAVGAWLLAALLQLPALLVLGGVTVAAIGLVPRFAVAISWAVLLGSLVVGQFGSLFELPQWVLNLSPFTHIPPVPSIPLAEVTATPFVWLTAVAVVLVAVGTLAYRRRDLRTS